MEVVIKQVPLKTGEGGGWWGGGGGGGGGGLWGGGGGGGGRGGCVGVVCGVGNVFWVGSLGCCVFV